MAIKTIVKRITDKGGRITHYVMADFWEDSFETPLCGIPKVPPFLPLLNRPWPPLCFECAVQYVLQDCMLEPEETNAWWLFWKMRREGREDPLKI